MKWLETGIGNKASALGLMRIIEGDARLNGVEWDVACGQDRMGLRPWSHGFSIGVSKDYLG